jgi:hypothetical protein
MLPAFMESPDMLKIHDSTRRAIRPTRWAYKLDGVELSRACLIRTWQHMKDASHIAPTASMYYHDGDGCRTAAKRNGKEGREVLTLRELLQVARIDYKPRNGAQE